jgi:hypothetical protein
MTSVNSDTASGYLYESDCRLADFIEIVEQPTQLSDYPFAESINHNVVIYDGDRIRAECSDDPHTRRAIQTELNKAFLEGPGIVVFKRAFPDTAIVGRPLRQTGRQRPGLERPREDGSRCS